MLIPSPKTSDRGATALTVALAMVVLMGIAAIAIDAGLGWNERRQDQTAADTAVMAGALDFAFGEQAIAEGVLEYVWRNLPSATGASWETDTAYRDTFRACTDPEAATLGLSLSPVTEPDNSGSGGVWDGSTNLPCISVSPLGYTRVRVPDQFVATTFGRAIGVNSLNTHAAAVALIAGRGRLGVLPFGLGSGVSGGDQICLSSAPTGLAEDPCVGAAAGNFGTLKLPIWGNPDVGTTQNCNSAPLNGALAINIAVGADHVIFLAPDISDAVEVRDDAAACAARTFGVNALDTDTGFPSGTESGLVGPLPGAAPASAVPRLLNSSDTISLFGRNIDDKPLWEYLSSSADGCFPSCLSGGPTVPEVCDPQTFDNGSGYVPAAWPHPTPGDWNGDAIVDSLESWEHMNHCLSTFETGGPQGILFDESIKESPRFSYTPQFWDTTLGSGGSLFPNVMRFRSVWIQGTWWKRGNNWSVHHPGEGCDTTGGGTCSPSEAMQQVSALVIPDLALPIELRGNPPPNGGLNPFQPTLFK